MDALQLCTRQCDDKVSLANLADFDLENSAHTIRGEHRWIPVSGDLAHLDDQGIDAVVDVCAFGFPAFEPKISKIGALFRPGAVPMLDGYVGLAFGFGTEAFTAAASKQGMDSGNGLTP